MIKFLFFAQLAEDAKCDSLQLEYQTGGSCKDYLDALAKRLPEQAIDSLNDGTVMLSINQVLAAWEDELSDGDEVGLLPPFSGG